MRQVQRSEEDPSVYVITYFGEHTCQDLIEAAHSLHHQNHRMIDFKGKTTSHFSTLKQEHSNEELDSMKNVHVVTGGSSSSDCFVMPKIAECAGGASEHSDVTLGSQSRTVGMAWEFMGDSVEYHDIFSYDHDVLFWR